MNKGNSGVSVLPPKIVCDKSVWSKLIAYSLCTVEQTARFQGKKTQRSRIEISGVGIVVQEDSRTFRIMDFLLIPSEGSGSTTEFINAGLVAAVEEILTTGNPEDVTNMRMWWHTHPAGNLTWSGQDIQTMVNFGDNNGYPWLLSIVTDGSGRYRCRLDIFPAMGGNFRTYFDNLTIDVEDSEISEILPNLQKEVDEKVKAKLQVISHLRASQGPYVPRGLVPRGGFHSRMTEHEGAYLEYLLDGKEPTEEDMTSFERDLRGEMGIPSSSELLAIENLEEELLQEKNEREDAS